LGFQIPAACDRPLPLRAYVLRSSERRKSIAPASRIYAVSENQRR
jgi:hypothetical protein